MLEPRVIGEWTKVSTLGSGGFGTVDLWRSSKNDEIAVKKCKFICVENLTKKQKARWHKEVQMIKELDHPNIIKFKPLPDILQEELNKYNPSKLPILSMEYCTKGNLRMLLNQKDNLSGLKEDIVRNILSDISSAISYLHERKITHRDIKPENIVLHECTSRHDETMYKIIDLGYAKELNDSTVSFVGTLLYLAPEIFENQDYDSSVDFWSFGIVVFEIICGFHPFASLHKAADRFQLLRNKDPDVLWMYIENSGKILKYSELNKENHINDCFKRNMEVWLRKVLQFDPKLRSLPFPNSNNVFQELNRILNLKIIKLFVVYKCQFFSYEFDGTLELPTLRKWLADDTGIAEEDILILSDVNLVEDRHEYYVYNKHSLFCGKEPDYPISIKCLFQSPMKSLRWSEIRSKYVSAIHYISQDIMHASKLSTAIKLYMHHIEIMVLRLIKKGTEARQCLTEVMQKVAVFNNKLKVKGYRTTNDTYNKVLRLYSSVKKYNENEFLLAQSIEEWNKKKDALRKLCCDMNVMKLPELQSLLDSALQLFQKAVDVPDRASTTFMPTEIMNVVCRAMGLKRKIYINEELNAFYGWLNRANDHLSHLLLWADSFLGNLKQLSSSFEKLSEVEYRGKEINAALSTSWCIVDTNKYSSGCDEYPSNELNRYIAKFENTFETSIDTIENICDEISTYVSDPALL